MYQLLEQGIGHMRQQVTQEVEVFYPHPVIQVVLTAHQD
jgi:hypothetical protein